MADLVARRIGGRGARRVIAEDLGLGGVSSSKPSGGDRSFAISYYKRNATDDLVESFSLAMSSSELRELHKTIGAALAQPGDTPTTGLAHTHEPPAKDDADRTLTRSYCRHCGHGIKRVGGTWIVMPGVDPKGDR